jgi:chromosome segregation ATPase
MDEAIKIAGALVASIAGLTFAYQRYSTLMVKEATVEAREGAVKSQFQNLQDAIEANRKDSAAARTEATEARKEAAEARKEAAEARKETAELRHEFARMDRVIHSQQRTIVRMELLLRQFSKLVQELGIKVPNHMQTELDDLMVDSETLAAKLAAGL